MFFVELTELILTFFTNTEYLTFSGHPVVDNQDVKVSILDQQFLL